MKVLAVAEGLVYPSVASVVAEGLVYQFVANVVAEFITILAKIATSSKSSNGETVVALLVVAMVVLDVGILTVAM